MSSKNVRTTYCWSNFLVLGVFIFILLWANTLAEPEINSNVSYNQLGGSEEDRSILRLFKRSSGKGCLNTTDCTEIQGSYCLQNTCVCPQGYLPIKKGVIGCFQVGKRLGNNCNTSAQCGEELTCKDHVCLCPDGQLFQIQDTNFCLFWHKPTRLVDRCRINEDCTHHDPNTICKKRWCQCNIGYQLFETMFFGRKHKCFKTYRFQCVTDSHCSKLAETPDTHCLCLYGFCHCINNLTFSSLDIPDWPDKPNWYQRWKKDLILATRLLFITVILFFVPCFIYVTLGMRERSRQLFSQFVQPTRSPVIHYSSQRRTSQSRHLQSYRGVPNNTRVVPDSHNVELTVNMNRVNSRLVDPRPRMASQPRNCDALRDISIPRDAGNGKEEDPPPSYEEIMHKESIPEEPPPPYRAL